MPGTPSPASSELAAGAERLLFQAQLQGRVELCRLSDEEQTLLGGIGWALAAPDVVTTWSQLSPAEQQTRLVAARRSLVRRGDAEVSEGDAVSDVLAPGAALGLVLAARTRSAYVVLTGAAEPSRLLSPRLYAIADEAFGLRALVVELTVDGIHDYRLVSPEYAARALTQWARRSLTTDDLGDKVGAVAVEILRHRQGETMTMGGAVLTETGGALTVGQRDFDGERRRTVAASDEEVESLLAGLLESAASTSVKAGVEA